MVVDKHLAPYELSSYHDTPDNGILLLGDHATIFSNRKAARAAITRTLRFSRKQDYGWQKYEYEIVPACQPKSLDVLAKERAREAAQKKRWEKEEANA
jgi:hypothetical protein